MKSIETTGKTVEDAIKAGLRELNCDSSDVTIDVLEMGSPGLFGMFGRLAKVRLTKKEAPEVEIEMPVMSLDSAAKAKTSVPRPQSKPAPAAAKPAREPASAPAVKPAPEERPAPQPAKSAAPAERRPERPAREAAPERESAPRTPKAPRIPAEPVTPSDPATLGEAGRRAYEFLANVTKLMGVTVSINVQEDAGQLTIKMSGDTLGVLIGRRGETLDALQYLTSLQVNRSREEYLRVSLDTENYRAKREESLIKLAGSMANRARKTGRRVALEPMNPYERRVLHSALQDNPYVTTHSEGDEPYRRVIITLKQQG